MLTDENYQNPCPSAKTIRLEDIQTYMYQKNPRIAEDGFILMDFGILFKFLEYNMPCPECTHHSLSCELSPNRNGFAHEIIVHCNKCKDWKTPLKISKYSTFNCHKEVNIRIVAFARPLGKGHSTLQNFSMYLNSPAPMTHRNYKKDFWQTPFC